MSLSHSKEVRQLLRHRSSLASGTFISFFFANGLPWVFTFDGLPGVAKPGEDGTLVVLSDLKALYDPNRTIFRSVHIAPNAHLVLHDREHRLRAFDSNGNPLEHPTALSRFH